MRNRVRQLRSLGSVRGGDGAAMVTPTRARSRKRWIHAKGTPAAATGPLLLGECCLRSEGELGWAIQLYRNGLLYASRRCVLHAEAVADAEEVRGDCEQDGWKTLTP